MAETYESLFSPEESASPSAAVLNRTAQYAGPSLPEAPTFRSAPEPNVWELIGLGLAGAGAGVQGRPDPTAGLLKSRQEPFDRENAQAQQSFENRMGLLKEGRAQGEEGRAQTKEQQKLRGQEKLRALLANEPMTQREPTVDPTTGAQIPGEKVPDVAQRNRLLAEAAVDINPDAALAILKGRGLTTSQIINLTDLDKKKSARTSWHGT